MEHAPNPISKRATTTSLYYSIDLSVLELNIFCVYANDYVNHYV